jgi:membrane fusion protein (multidrug efflux system)
MQFIRIIGLGLLLVMLLASCSKNGKNQQKNEKPPVKVDVIIASESDFATDLEVNGTVLSEEMVELHPETGGRITYLNIPDGSVVSVGTVLARVNDAELQAQLQQQKVQLELAEKTEARLRKLLTINGVDQASYDAALSQVNLYNANINVLKAQIDKTIVRAPFTGKLGLRLISQGAYVSPSTAIGTLQQTDRIKIDFAVPESYASLIKPGKEVGILSGETESKAVISAIEPQISSTTRNYKVRARLHNSGIVPGAFVKVILNQNIKGIVVPTHAVIPDALSSQVVVVESGKAMFKNVETGFRNADVVEITKGINPGDSILVSGVLFVRPKAPVQVMKVRTLNPVQ